jgi:hypothetical protein
MISFRGEIFLKQKLHSVINLFIFIKEIQMIQQARNKFELFKM